MNLLQRLEWRLYKECKRIRLKNRNATIISSNCIGSFVYHDMRMEFLTPTINLSFDMNDYVRFLSDLKGYLDMPLLPLEDKRFDYPCGLLGDIEIRFNHYDTFEEAAHMWEKRTQRIKFDNLFIMGIDGDNCTEETLKKFDELPFEHKVIFTHIPRPDINSSYYIGGFEEAGEVGELMSFKKQFRIRRYLDDFDYISFLNGEQKGQLYVQNT